MDDLIRRLAEAEGTIKALISGQVDTVVDSTGNTHILLRQAQDALLQSEQKFQTLTESMPQLAWMCTPDGGYIYFNQRWADYTGLTLNESYGPGWSKPYHPDDQQRAKDAWKHATRTGEPFEIESRLRGADGNYRWFLIRALPFRDSGGTILKWLGTCTDIEQHKRSEEKIRRLASIVESSQDAIISKSLTGVILTWNRGAEEIYGYSAAEMIGKSSMILYSKDSPQELTRVLESSVAQKIVNRYESVHVRKDGSRIVVSVTVSPVHDSSGEVVALSVISRDITERRKSDEALRKSELEQRAIAEKLEKERARLDDAQAVAKVGSWENELATGHLTWSRETYRIFERDPESFIPTQQNFFSTMVHPEDHDAVKEAFLQSFITNTCHVLEHRVSFPDGRIKYVQERWRIFHDVDGRPLRALGTVQDITERKQFENNLRKSEERFRSLALATSQIVWWTDAAGHVTEDMPSWREYTGMSLEQILQDGWSNSLHPDDRARVLAHWNLCVANKSLYEIDYRIRRADGVYRLFSVRGIPVIEENQIREWIGTCTDITKRAELEEQLRQSHKMDAIGRLAGGVAHDFNNVLTVILGRAELLQSRTDIPEQARKSILLIQETANRAAKLTRQLLQFSRQQVLQPKIIDFNALLCDMQEMLRRLISEDIELSLKLEKHLWHINIDPSQVEQVVMNLVINARDAMPNGGRINLETSNIEITDAYIKDHVQIAPGPHVMLTVNDTGCGISEQVKARIFEPFFTTKEQGKGTGLGLSTVYGIVKQAGGSIFVYSQVGHGTTFKLYFPATRERRTAKIPLQSLQPVDKGGGETILIVEDEGEIRELLREILLEKGYKVIAAVDGEDALQRSSAFPGTIHLMLTDVIMPKMSGRELSERLAITRPKMPVIFMSGYTADVMANRGMFENGINYLEKPFTPVSVLSKVRSTLAGATSN